MWYRVTRIITQRQPDNTSELSGCISSACGLAGAVAPFFFIYLLFKGC